MKPIFYFKLGLEPQVNARHNDKKAGNLFEGETQFIHDHYFWAGYKKNCE